MAGSIWDMAHMQNPVAAEDENTKKRQQLAGLAATAQKPQAAQTIQQPPSAQTLPTTTLKRGGRVRGCGIARKGLTRGKMV